jgi:hypothetical protein
MNHNAIILRTTLRAAWRSIPEAFVGQYLIGAASRNYCNPCPAMVAIKVTGACDERWQQGIKRR